MKISCCRQISYLNVFFWMYYEFGQGICVCMLTCSIDNFYGCFRNLRVRI